MMRGFWLGLFAVGTATAVWAQSNDDCLECHADDSLERADGSSVYVSQDMGTDSVHEGWACVDCHVTATEDHDEDLPPAACGGCHEDAAEAVSASLHGQVLARGDDGAPLCGDCHHGHDIRYIDDPESPVYRTNIPQTCGNCHADPQFTAQRPLMRTSPIVGYEKSVHYAALLASGEGATCTDCHESHDLFRQSDPRSAIFDQNVPATCGQCHGEIEQVYERSIHGKALAAGELDAPDCADCHGEHEIRGPDDPESMVYPAHVSETTCVWCHESERIVKRYGLPGGRQETYEDSYHGLADRGGSTTVANCASCHGIHNILPSSDPASMINAANIPATCGKCHPGADANFAKGMVHVDKDVGDGENPIVHWVRRFYIWLIVAVVGGMALHNGIDFVRKGRAPRLPRGLDFLRFTISERLQHAVMASSFIVLAYSGFALKFPGGWWATPFTWLGDGEAARRLVHRAAAVAMVAVCLYHLFYLALTRRGREQLREMAPKLQDVRDAAQMIGYYLGRQPRGPAFARFSYVEKAEYWALVWGSVVMTVTGFSLWFENQTLAIVPLWVVDLATVVHYYEAWLATLAIIVWHFYWVIFNPEIYPMSLVWWNGHMSEEEMRHEHPKELERLRERGGNGTESS